MMRVMRSLARRGGFHASARTVATGLAIASFVTLCALPVAWMLGVSFIDSDGGLTVRNYGRLFAESRQRQLMLNSALLGAGASLLAALIGAPLGLLLARTSFPLKRLLRIALVTPLVIPPYILALAWIYIGGPAGLMAQLFGRDLLSEWTYSLTGAVVVLGAGFYPLAMLASEAAARRVDGRLEEAALLVASRRRVLWRITLPLVAPSMVAAALIIFVLAISEFGAPGIVARECLYDRSLHRLLRSLRFRRGDGLGNSTACRGVDCRNRRAIRDRRKTARHAARRALGIEAARRTQNDCCGACIAGACRLRAVAARRAGARGRTNAADHQRRLSVTNGDQQQSVACRHRGDDGHDTGRVAGVWTSASANPAARSG